MFATAPIAPRTRRTGSTVARKTSPRALPALPARAPCAGAASLAPATVAGGVSDDSSSSSAASGGEAAASGCGRSTRSSSLARRSTSQSSRKAMYLTRHYCYADHWGSRGSHRGTSLLRLEARARVRMRCVCAGLGVRASTLAHEWAPIARTARRWVARVGWARGGCTTQRRAPMRKPAAHSAADAASMNRSAQSSTAAENADTPIEPSPPTYGATRRHSCSACARRCVRACR